MLLEQYLFSKSVQEVEMTVLIVPVSIISITLSIRYTNRRNHLFIIHYIGGILCTFSSIIMTI